MRYFALATDYDGTIAHHGFVDETTLQALQKLKESGRKLILVTGRELPDLLKIFPNTQICDRIVVENGALLYRPSSREEKVLSEPASQALVDLLRERGVRELSVGRVIVATQEPYESVALSAIRELGLELQVIFNKGAVMVLPSGVNKATGLAAALDELGLSAHNVVGIGDAENDHAFLELCECSAAVANALPALKERADFTTSGDHGAGVAELIDAILGNELQAVEPRLRRHHVSLGIDEDGNEISISPCGASVFVAGASGGGKSTFVTGFMERLLERRYQACIIDPEGDYPELEDCLALGTSQRPPSIDELIPALEKPHQNVVVNLIGIQVEDRPAFFHKLLPHLQEMRARTGRPHWIVIDEAHHVLPASWQSSPLIVPLEMKGVMFVAVQPDHVASTVLGDVDLVVALGEAAKETIQMFGAAVGIGVPPVSVTNLEKGEALGWWRSGTRAFRFKSIPTKGTRRRHIRKYSQGELKPDESFYFEGPEKKLHLRAQNLQTFLQLADGVDDETWLHHLQSHDYSRWFRNQLKDEDLATAAEDVEHDKDMSPAESRARMRSAIEDRYTAPA